MGADPPTAPAGPPTAPDAPHEAPSLAYLPALDGLRALAVLGVMAFHSAIPFLPAGFLGVDTFFVLSGFLITSLLLGEWRRRMAIRLGAFWARRARRLLPALFLVLVFVAVYAEFVVPKGTYPDLRLDALSTLFYVANWHFILIGSNYFVQSGPVSLLTHTWSLAIEEQFYLVWPLVVLVVMHFTKSLRVLLGVCVVGTVASAAEMALLYHPGMNLTRLYYGTDTHAQVLLVGATLAVVLAMVAERRRSQGTVPVTRTPHPVGGDPAWVAKGGVAKNALVVAGGFGLVVSAVMWWRVSYNASFLWRGGFLVAALATAAVLGCVVCVQGSWLATALSFSPLRFLGRISYGMYLWHFPLFQWIDGQRTGLTGYPLFAVRAVATIAVATVSFFLVERPIRQGQFFHRWRAWAVTPVAAVAVATAVVLATSAPALSALPTARPAPGSTLYSGPPVKVMMIGDSTALTLGIGLSISEKPYDVDEQDQAILGCGVVVGSQYTTKGTYEPVAPSCNSNKAPPSMPRVFTTPPPLGSAPRPGAELWTVWYKNWVAKFDPNVVMILAGRWEVMTRTYQGTWTNITHPAFAAYVKSQLGYAVRIADARGARVVLLTAPCYDVGEQPNGQLWPTSTPRRVTIYNTLVEEVAAENPATTSVLHFHSMVCPGGTYHEFLDGVQVRTSDGIHFTDTGGEFLAPRIWPTVVKIGREQMAAARR
ncbi:MAG: DUF459 domain-containing protein [Acidimicrobiales bacterium]